jgi:hypothetical protein
MGPERQVLLHIEAVDGDHPEDAAEGGWRLKDEIAGLDVNQVDHAPTDAVPGAKGDALAWAELIVTLSGSLPALVAAVRSWVSRDRTCNVTLELDGDRLVLEGVRSEEQLALAKEWLERHDGG